ncbi:hypothetical protein EDB80DRAFT_348996 [Ilyonectria destructans]|nr:hypothetical protein EDB80DRAFT_348996 [Ilyonectria destructans]
MGSHIGNFSTLLNKGSMDGNGGKLEDQGTRRIFARSESHESNQSTAYLLDLSCSWASRVDCVMDKVQLEREAFAKRGPSSEAPKGPEVPKERNQAAEIITPGGPLQVLANATSAERRCGGRKCSSWPLVSADIRPFLQRTRPILPKEGNREGDSGELIPRPEELAADLVGCFGRLDKREYEQQNEVLGVLQSRTSAGVVDVACRVGKRRYKARAKKQKRPSRHERLMNATFTFQPIRPKESADAEPRAGITADGLDGSRQGEPTQYPSRGNANITDKRQRLRSHRPSKGQPPRKRVRTEVRRQTREVGAEQALASVLRWLEEDFNEKERLSNSQEWCRPIPLERKMSTVQEFYEAFRDPGTLPICTCMICYRKCTKDELKEVIWDEWVSSLLEKRDGSPLSCRTCFPMGSNISGCGECVRHLKRSSLSPAAQLHCRLGCEHMFPDELKGLTPVEEKLIALNSRYGFITRYSIPDGKRQGVRYPRHVKGHITVFPNNVQELVTKVLPHPLVTVMEEIHVSWQGTEKPAPSDLSALLSVRRRVVEGALVWLKKNNPHYADIEIDVAEMDSWGGPLHGVPSQVYEHMERNEPSAWERRGRPRSFRPRSVG